MQTAYLDNLNAEGLKPGQEPVQGGLIPQRAVQDSLDRLHRGVEPLEVQQGFGRQDPDDADLVAGRGKTAPSLSGWARANTSRSRVLACAAPCTTGESIFGQPVVELSGANAVPALSHPVSWLVDGGWRRAGITRGGWSGTGRGWWTGTSPGDKT